MWKKIDVSRPNFIYTLIIFFMVIFSSPSFGNSKDHLKYLVTPETTLKTYYAAFKKSNFEYQKKTFLNSIESVGKVRFNEVNPIFKSYQIIKIRVVKEKEYDFYQKGDVDVLVKEIYKNKKNSINSFILRKINNDWLIIDFVTENKAEFKDKKLLKKIKRLK